MTRRRHHLLGAMCLVSTVGVTGVGMADLVPGEQTDKIDFEEKIKLVKESSRLRGKVIQNIGLNRAAKFAEIEEQLDRNAGLQNQKVTFAYLFPERNIFDVKDKVFFAFQWLNDRLFSSVDPVTCALRCEAIGKMILSNQPEMLAILRLNSGLQTCNLTDVTLALEQLKQVNIVGCTLDVSSRAKSPRYFWTGSMELESLLNRLCVAFILAIKPSMGNEMFGATKDPSKKRSWLI